MNKKDAFKKVISLAPKDEPAADLTENIMNSIAADEAREAVLKALLQKQSAEGPAFNFTAGVMANLSAQSKPLVFKPIISKKAWYSIAATVAVFFILIALVNSSSHHLATGNSVVADVMKYVRLVPSFYFVVLALAVLLLFTDHLLTRHSKKLNAV